MYQHIKYPVYWRQLLHLLEIYFKRILYCSQWQRIFFLVETIFFHSHFFWKPLLQLEGGQYFKIILFLLEETVFFNFFQIMIRMEVAFRSSEIVFFKESFILASEKGFSINCKLLFGAFFCWWTQFLKLGVKQFSSIFSIPNSGSSFSG